MPLQPMFTASALVVLPVRVTLNVIGSGPVSEPSLSVDVIDTTGDAATSLSAMEPLALDGEPRCTRIRSPASA